MQIERDLIFCGDGFNSELFIQDAGYLGIRFVFLRADGQWFKMRVAPHELAPLIAKLTDFRDRAGQNKLKGE